MLCYFMIDDFHVLFIIIIFVLYCLLKKYSYPMWRSCHLLEQDPVHKGLRVKMTRTILEFYLKFH